MRLTFFLCATCCVAAIAAAGASAAVPNSGCPDSAVHTEVSYVLSPSEDWRDTTLYTFQFVDTTQGQSAMESFGVSEEGAYFILVAFLERVDVLVDDQTACINWVGRNPGQTDFHLNAVDNTANA
jgi:hypothetical protein